MGVIINTEAPNTNTEIIYDVNNLSVVQNTMYDTGITYDAVKAKYKYLVVQVIQYDGYDTIYHNVIYTIRSGETAYYTDYYTSLANYQNGVFYQTGITVGNGNTLKIRLDIIGYTGYTLKGVRVIGVK